MKSGNILFFTIPIVLRSVIFLNKLLKEASTTISIENLSKYATLQISPEKEGNFI